MGDFSTSNKRGLRKLRSFKNKADSKVFNSQSDEGRELARREIHQNSRHTKRELAQTQIFQPRQNQKTKSATKLIDDTQEHRK